MKWEEGSTAGVVVAGGSGRGESSSQFNYPRKFDVNVSTRALLIADCNNHRVVLWEEGASSGTVQMGIGRPGTNYRRRGHGHHMEKLYHPYDASSARTAISLFSIRTTIEYCACRPGKRTQFTPPGGEAVGTGSTSSTFRMACILRGAARSSLLTETTTGSLHGRRNLMR